MSAAPLAVFAAAVVARALATWHLSRRRAHDDTWAS